MKTQVPLLMLNLKWWSLSYNDTFWKMQVHVDVQVSLWIRWTNSLSDMYMCITTLNELNQVLWSIKRFGIVILSYMYMYIVCIHVYFTLHVFPWRMKIVKYKSCGIIVIKYTCKFTFNFQSINVWPFAVFKYRCKNYKNN